MNHAPVSRHRDLVRHYEEIFSIHGDGHLGVDWPNLKDLHTRFRIMTELLRNSSSNSKVSVLDFGCGNGLLLEYLENVGLLKSIDYTGLDLGESFVAHCRTRFPRETFLALDVLESPEMLPCYDYIIMNGVLTEKRNLSDEEMLDLLKKLVLVVFGKANFGLAFNVMSTHVDWKRDDLFHLPMDRLAEFLVKEVSRNFVIRNDYGLYEYTAYVYKKSIGTEESSWQKS